MNAPWSPRQQLGFRFVFTIGGGLIILSILGSSLLGFLLAPAQAAMARVWAFVSGTDYAPLTQSGSGDTLAIWQYHLGWLVVGTVLTLAWTLMDRHRTDYRALAGVLFVFARYCLALGMILYGMVKVLPTQMGMMSLPTYALQPAGDVRRMNMLWSMMGASDGYSVATGLVELTSGVLLLFGRTWIVGALGAIIAMTQVVLLDTFYNVPVKFLAFEFLVIAVALLIPVWPNLWRTVFGRRTEHPVVLWRPAGADRTWLRRTGTVVAAVGAVAMIALTGTIGTLGYVAQRQVRNDLDGTWHAVAYRVDGTEPTLSRADDVWINIAITQRGRGITKSLGENYSAFVSQTPDARVRAWTLSVDGDVLAIAPTTEAPKTRLTVHQPNRDRLSITGIVDGARMEASYVRRPMQRASERLLFTHPEPDPRQPVGDFP